MYYPAISASQESRHGLIGPPHLRVSHKATVKVLTKAVASSEFSPQKGCFPSFHMVVGRIPFLTDCFIKNLSSSKLWVEAVINSLLYTLFRGQLTSQHLPSLEWNE